MSGVSGFSRRLRDTASGHIKSAKTRGADIRNSGQARLRKAVEDRVEKVTDKIVEVAVAKIGVKLKYTLRDDSMPKFVIDTIDGGVDEMLPDLEMELKGKTRNLYRQQSAHDLGERASCFPMFPCWIRHWVLYTLYPFDRTIWQQIRTVSFWLLTLISAVPVYGVHQVYFLLVLLMKDRGDEYQVIQFILSFKGMSFISQGVIPIIRGSAQMYSCAVRLVNTCEDDAPRIAYLDMGWFLLQVVLVWIAFLILPWTVKKGRARFKHEDVEESKGTVYCCLPGYEGRGGALRFWIIYDVLCFLLCAGLMGYVIFEWYDVDPFSSDELERNEWLVLATLYWIKALYGLLSFPFAVFKVPVMSGLLTHAAATGYSRNGRTMKMMKKKKEKDREALAKKMEEWDREIQAEKARGVDDITDDLTNH